MPAVETTGTQSASTGIDYTLATLTSARTYVLIVDTTNVANGDVLELWILTKVLTGGSLLKAYHAVYSNAQDAVVKVSIPVPSDYSCEFHLKWTGASGPKNFDWRVDSV